MSSALKVAQVMDWMLELIPVWEVPVTAAMIREAIPDYSRPVITAALKQLASDGLLFVKPDSRDRMFYLPTTKRPVCAIQEYLCKGRLFI